MPERFEDALKALRHVARGNGLVMKIAARLESAHKREVDMAGVAGAVDVSDDGPSGHEWTGDYRPITSELRAAMPVSYGHVDMEATRFDHLCDAIDAVHASLERENASLRVELDDALDGGIPMTDENMLAEGWIRLPKDADGEYVHIGDLMAYADNTKAREVVALVPPAVFLTEDGPRYADMCRHYHAQTVEDVLFEFAQFWSDEELTDIEHLQPDAAQTIVEFAAKLRLAGEDA